MFKGEFIKISLLNSKFFSVFKPLILSKFYLVMFNMTKLFLLTSIYVNCFKLVLPLHLKILFINMIGGPFASQLVSS